MLEPAVRSDSFSFGLGTSERAGLRGKLQQQRLFKLPEMFEHLHVKINSHI